MALYKELRVGNWIQTTNNDNWNVAVMKSPVEVTISILQLVQHTTTLYEPIPLTPEWLERLGFEKRKDSSWYSIVFHGGPPMMGPTEVNELSVEPEFGRCAISFIGYIDAPFKKPSGVYLGYEIQYVHELQNAYLFITGTELTVKEKVEKE